jgi:hypothetical protein
MILPSSYDSQLCVFSCAVVIDSNASSTASSIDLKSVNRGKIDVTVSQTPPSSNAAKVNAVSIGADVASSTSKPLPMSSAHIASLPEDIESRKRGLESSEDGSRGKVDEMNGKLMKGERPWVFLFSY